ncbi:adult-specific cuticular protein ACP-20-like [Planococcus citri]|uniref:adult-specific cuticular protein ACP-20-like n=1 Tax=Planococcus citri TaxID=170843 RepID=UPI0031F8F37B
MYGFSLIVCALSLFSMYQCIPPYGSSDVGYGGGYSSHGDEHHESPKPYAFGYSVKDFKKGTNFNQHENSDGHTIKGQYEVALPDGRMQIVSYHADWKNGYHADVKYVGEAEHPELYAHHDSGSYGAGYGHGGDATSSNFQNIYEGGHHYRK